MNYNYMSYGERRQIRNVDGTPPLQYKVPSIVASGRYVLDIKAVIPTFTKYLPFDAVTINNNGGTELNVLINGESDRAIYLANGVIKSYSGNVGIWSLVILNLSTTTATTVDKVVLEFERLGMTPDNFTKQLARGVLGRLFVGGQ